MNGVKFTVESKSVGEKAYEEADQIAECMENFLGINNNDMKHQTSAITPKAESDHSFPS